MKAIGWLLQSTMGTATGVAGLACTPTSPASLTVNVGPGAIWSFEEIDTTAYGSLSADTSPLMKMGINAESAGTSFTLTAPTTSGQSINYLIEASFLEQDGTAVVLPYVNPASPSTPYSGPSNSGAAQNTMRVQSVDLQLLAGAPANTGTQTTPATTSGWVPLYVITVNHGQTTITAGGITPAAGAPFLPFTLPQVTNGHGQCRLSAASTTSLLLSPYNGINVIVNGLPLQLPAAGVSITNSGLADSTLYYVYLGGTTAAPSLTISATTYSMASNGVQTMTGNTALTLVGMIYTTTSGQFSDAMAFRGVLNWFNRRSVVGQNSITAVAGGSSSGAEITSAARVVFLSWASSFTTADAIGEVSNTTANASAGAYIGFDVTSGLPGYATSITLTSANIPGPAASQNDQSLAEGMHFATLLGVVAGGVATYTLGYRVINEG
jgi:hypothetical protein